MPNRIIKESICESRKLSEVSFFAEDLFKRLIVYADDYGRFNADYQIILARLYPREIGIVSVDDIEDALTELVGVGKIAFYTSTPRKEIYGCFPNWADHQRVRDSKKRCPEPDDTSVNDWYYRRFISRDMKRRILERDKMKCQECGKYIFADISSVDRALKFGAGLYHIDHIVPVNQGGRATEENLRLTCSSCNLRRKKRFSIEEIIEFTQNPPDLENLQEIPEICGNLQKISATSGLNPIQSESESNPNNVRKRTESEIDADFQKFWDAYPRHDTKAEARKIFGKLNPDNGLLNTMLTAIEQQKRNWTDPKYIPQPRTWLNQKRWEDEPLKQGSQAPAKGVVVAQQYDQRDYSGQSRNPDDILDMLEAM